MKKIHKKKVLIDHTAADLIPLKKKYLTSMSYYRLKLQPKFQRILLKREEKKAQTLQL